MSLQLYQVDQKNYLLDFKSLDIADHPDAARVKRMTKASMTGSGDEPTGQSLCLSVCLSLCVCVYVSPNIFKWPCDYACILLPFCLNKYERFSS